jgi:hypothetical protein
MTKKNFIALANCIISANSRCSVYVQDHLRFSDNQISKLADFCQSQNPNFNRERWLSYIAGECGSNGGTIK